MPPRAGAARGPAALRCAAPTSRLPAARSWSTRLSSWSCPAVKLLLTSKKLGSPPCRGQRRGELSFGQLSLNLHALPGWAWEVGVVRL